MQPIKSQQINRFSRVQGHGFYDFLGWKSLWVLWIVILIDILEPRFILAKKSTYVVDAIHLHEPTTQELEYKSLADEAYSQGDLTETLRQLKRAYQVRKNPRYLANQGLVLADFGRYQEAVKLLEEFIKTNPPLPKRKAAQAEIVLLKPEVQISSEPVGAEVYVSGSKKLLGTTPFKQNLISGEYRIVLQKEGYDPLRVSLFVSPGKPVLASYVLNSKLVITGPPLPSTQGHTPSHFVTGQIKQGRHDSIGPKALSILSASATLISVYSYFLTRDALIDREQSQTSIAWARAQGETEAYYQMSLVSASIASLSGLGAFGWWLYSQP